MKDTLYSIRKKKTNEGINIWGDARTLTQNAGFYMWPAPITGDERIINFVNDTFPTLSGSGAIIATSDLATTGLQGNKFLAHIADTKRSVVQNPIWFKSKFLGSLDSSFSYLINEIEDSKYILEKKIDVDDDESAFYTPDVWVRSIKFIIKYANHILNKDKQHVLNPKIYHGPDGSVDFYWQYPHLNMLLNIPSKGSGSFSGDDNGTNKFNGFFNPDEPNFKFMPSIY